MRPFILPVLAMVLALAACTSVAPQPTPTAPVTPPPPATSPATARPQSTARPDFDGDGKPDLAVGIGDRPARVSVSYAGRTVEFDRSQLDGTASGDFGQALLAADLDRDGYADLVIGDPDAGAEDGPAVFLVFGSPDGLDVEGARRLSAPAGSAAFGLSLALVSEPAPLLAVGVGMVGTDPAGAVAVYPLGGDGLPLGEPTVIGQATEGIPGEGRPGDGFGTVLAATGSRLVIGIPRKDVGGAADAGAVVVLRYLGGTRFEGVEITQASPGVPDDPEPGDRFGFSLAAGDGFVVVGAPLEDRGGRETGLVQPFRIEGDTLRPLAAIDAASIGGTRRSGDAFGRTLAIARPCPLGTGVLIGVTSATVTGVVLAGRAWLVPLAASGCPVRQFAEGGTFGGRPVEMALLGSAVGALRSGDGPDTLVIVAVGTSEEGVAGRVFTLEPPYEGRATSVLTGLRIHEERTVTLARTAD